MPTYSRISKHETQRILRQIIVLLCLTALVIGVFIFILLPLAIRTFSSLSGSSSPVKRGDALPPQTPVIFTIVEATNSADLSVSGFAQPETTITLYRNGSRVQETSPDAEGKFSFSSFMIAEGDNQLNVVSRNKDNAEATSSIHNVVLDTQSPELNILEPLDKTAITRRREQAIAVKIQSEGGVRAYLNDKFLFGDTQGNYSGTFQLSEGDNTLRFRVVDKAGNQTEKEIMVSFRP